MVERPKRRKSKDNPYTLLNIDESGIYKVSFKDCIGILRVIEVSKEVYEAFDSFELEDKSQMNKYDRYIEHSEIFENNINERALFESESLEDEIIKKATFEDLKDAIEKLPDIQKTRIKKYYFEDLSMVEIAKQDNCSKVAVKQSLECAIENLKKNLEN